MPAARMVSSGEEEKLRPLGSTVIVNVILAGWWGGPHGAGKPKLSQICSSMGFLGALPARFRRERVLIVGCGDVGGRVVRELGHGRRVQVLALTSSPARVAA